jgi:hypothetical protein
MPKAPLVPQREELVMIEFLRRDQNLEPAAERLAFA